MNLRMVYTINTVLGLFFGLAFILVPDTLLDFYGITLDEAGLMVARLLGAAYCGYGVLSWFIRGHSDSPAGVAATTGIFATYVLGLIVAIIGQLGGVTNALGWSTVAIFLLMSVGFGYYRFMNQG